MPAARPDDDALAVLIAVRAEFGDDRGVREGAFLDIHNRMTKHLLRRGVSHLLTAKRVASSAMCFPQVD